MFKKVSYLILAVIIAIQISPLVPMAFAAVTAELKFADPSAVTLIKGCPSTIEIKLNTGGESVLAGDTKFSLTGDAVINNVAIGSILPMQTYNQVDGKQIKLSGARFPNTGGFNGIGTLGTINITPSASANSISVTFSPDIVLDNNIVNGDIENVLKTVTNATYTVRDKYNSEIDGGFCTPDITAPVFTMSEPLPNSKNNPANTNITFGISDNRSGVNISTLQFTINGSTPSDPIITQSNGVYQIIVNPNSDFPLGSQVDVNLIKVCDNDGNCLNNQAYSFRIAPPASCGDGVVDSGEECDNGAANGNMNVCTSSCTTAKCGDGYIWWGNEECDDGNAIGGDGCSSTCELEGPSTTTVVVTEYQTAEQQQQVECPVCPECPECPVCEEIVRVEYIQAEEVSKEEQDTAVETATIVLRETETIVKTEYIINTENKCDAFNFEIDSDKDGLSDKMECYLGTDINNPDTDGDSCIDSSEVNQFMTNPLIEDCKQEEKITGEVIITDPQAGWIVSTLKINGTTPKETTAVDIVAFPAEDKILKNLINELTTVITTNSSKLEMLTARIEEAKNFVNTYNESYDYADLDTAVTKLDNALASINDKIEMGESVDIRTFANNLTELQSLSKVSIYLGKSLPKAENDTMDLGTLRFKLEPVDVKLASEKLYDLVATSLLTNNEKISSVPIRINVNREILVKKPIPRFIGSVRIPSEIMAGGILLESAQADGDIIEIEVTDKRPIISGDCEFGVQVFAVWESIVLSSSVISDSDEGAFSIQPPKDLKPNENHKVTLYALKTDDDGQKMRSENVEIQFKIHEDRNIWIILLWILLLMLIMLGAGYILWTIAKRRNKEEEKPVEGLIDPAVAPAFEESSPEAESSADTQAEGEDDQGTNYKRILISKS